MESEMSWGRFKKRSSYKTERYKGKTIYFKAYEDEVSAFLHVGNNWQRLATGDDKKEALEEAKYQIDNRFR